MTEHGNTVVVVRDQTELLGLMQRISDLGLTLISASPTTSGCAPAPGRPVRVHLGESARLRPARAGGGVRSRGGGWRHRKRPAARGRGSVWLLPLTSQGPVRTRPRRRRLVIIAPGAGLPCAFCSCSSRAVSHSGAAVSKVDLDDQRDQTAQAQQEAEQAGKDVKALAGEVDEISQSVSDAGDQLSQAGADAEKNAQQALDGLGTKLESFKGQVEKAIEDSGASQDSSTP